MYHEKFIDSYIIRLSRYYPENWIPSNAHRHCNFPDSKHFKQIYIYTSAESHASIMVKFRVTIYRTSSNYVKLDIKAASLYHHARARERPVHINNDARIYKHHAYRTYCGCAARSSRFRASCISIAVYCSFLFTRVVSALFIRSFSLFLEL